MFANLKTVEIRDCLNADLKVYRIVRDVLLMLSASAAIALSAQAAVPLPFTPVPLTLQTLFVLLSGALLGSKRGPASVVLYIVLGIVGIPVFASGGVGFARLAGPTGGYLLGFTAASFAVGFLFERGLGKLPLTRTVAMLAGSVLIYAFGLPRLASFTGWDKVLVLGLYPFISGDLLKLGAAIILLHSHSGYVQTPKRKG